MNLTSLEIPRVFGLTRVVDDPVAAFCPDCMDEGKSLYHTEFGVLIFEGQYEEFLEEIKSHDPSHHVRRVDNVGGRFGI